MQSKVNILYTFLEQDMITLILFVHLYNNPSEAIHKCFTGYFLKKLNESLRIYLQWSVTATYSSPQLY